MIHRNGHHPLFGTTRTAGTTTPHRFTGQHHDPETGLRYNRHRYYNPHTTTYTTPDPLGQAPNPDSNRAYVHNPLTWVDPLGLQKCIPNAANSGSALSRASQAAFRAAEDPASIFVKNKHLASARGNGAKFASDDIGQVQGWISRGLQSDGVQFLPNGLDDTFRAIVPGGEAIGTRGQEIIRVIVTGDGRVINSFPVNVR